MTQRQAFLLWVLGSAALMLIGSFGPWIKALGGSVSGTDGSNDGWLVVAAAVIGSALFLIMRSAKIAGFWALFGGIAGAVTTIHDRHKVSSAIDTGGAFAKALVQIGWGLNLAMIASISFAIAGLVWVIKHQPERAAQASASSPVDEAPAAAATPTPPSA